ncbi:WD repeat domain-containing protein 83 [Nymphon striatum]|nr:WD repeat domain-containing protein 83 [Nymphon striatum]
MTGSDLPTTRETCLDCNQGAVRSVKFNDHIVLKFKRNNTSSSFTSSSSHSHIDIASAADFLSDPAFLAIPETQLVSRINSIFSSCSIQAPRRKKNSKPWFNAHSYDLRARCKLLSQSTNRQDYIIARKAYHHHLHHAKLIYEKNQESALINSALEKGLPALYKSAKAKTNGSTIPISRLHSYANKLFSSDSSYNTFMPIPSCDQNNHSLMSPFLLSELIKILKSVKSKAPSATGCLSPHTLKLLHLDIAPLLLRIFNYALSTGYFPECWLETVLFFLHKKGSKSDPSNYRTIAIENPFLKVFMLLINSRMTQYAESESLLPDFQFGFRPNRNFRQDTLLSPPFKSKIGTPQGDPISPLLFSLYIADLPSSLAPASVNFPSDIPINCPLYADDTCLIADTADELQLSLDSLTEYCKINHLIINVSKSKVVVFHKGRLPVCNFTCNQSPLERVNEFKYLGIYFSSQLVFSKHVSYICCKAQARIAHLFYALPITHLSLDIVHAVFRCFILPIFTYGSHIWLSSFSKSSEASVNSVLTKFLKRYLCLPVFSHNALTHLFTRSQPLLFTLRLNTFLNPLKCAFPDSLSGHRFSFIHDLSAPTDDLSISSVPPTFWSLFPVIHHIPSSPTHRLDGNYCLTCGSDKTLKLWNPFSGTLLQTFSGHGYEVLDAQGSCDNSQLVSCGLDKTAILWDVSTAVPLRKFRGHAAKVNCVRFNEESSVILTGSLDCTVRIWDCRSKSRDPVQTLDEAKDSITSLEVSDHEIVTGSLDCALRRYDIRVGQMFEDTIGRSISCVKFTKDGQCILTKLFG